VPVLVAVELGVRVVERGADEEGGHGLAAGDVVAGAGAGEAVRVRGVRRRAVRERREGQDVHQGGVAAGGGGGRFDPGMEVHGGREVEPVPLAVVPGRVGLELGEGVPGSAASEVQDRHRGVRQVGPATVQDGVGLTLEGHVAAGFAGVRRRRERRAGASGGRGGGGGAGGGSDTRRVLDDGEPAADGAPAPGRGRRPSDRFRAGGEGRRPGAA